MKEYIVTIDTGTTNTRTTLLTAAGKAVGSEKASVGVRNTAVEGSNRLLKQAIKGCLDAMLEKAGVRWEQVSCVLASGMITSNVGLVEVPHVTAPVSAAGLGAALHAECVPDVCPLPIHFIPGVKNSAAPVTLDNLEQMDIMRGEETEACAVMAHYGTGTPLLLVLPGSHTKFVTVDAAGNITGCLTTIAGELLSVITNNTILADAVQHSFVEDGQYDADYLMAGCRTAEKVGLGRACFSGRILNQFATKDSTKIANFLLGAVLQNDVDAIRHSAALGHEENTHVIVAGKNPLRQAMRDILLAEGTFARVEEYLPEQDLPMSAAGALLIARAAGLL